MTNSTCVCGHKSYSHDNTAKVKYCLNCPCMNYRPADQWLERARDFVIALHGDDFGLYGDEFAKSTWVEMMAEFARQEVQSERERIVREIEQYRQRLSYGQSIIDRCIEIVENR